MATESNESNESNTITRERLKQRIDRDHPDNEDRQSGFALVNVLDTKHFDREHIPGSINIPMGHEEEFEKRFAKDKEIILYCASPSCNASEQVMKNLRDRGYKNVVDYEKGMSDWKDADYEYASKQR